MASNQPNPSVVAKIWARVFEWAVESGRIPEEPKGPEAPKAAPSGLVCIKCSKGELHVHEGGRMCGCEECHQLFHYPSMVEVV